MEIRRSKSGFTLIELLIAMALCMAILSGATMMYVNGLNEQVSNETQMAANTEAQNLATYIDRDLVQGYIIPTSAVTIATPSSAAGTYSPDGDDLVFQIPSWDSVNSKTLSGVYDTIIYQFVKLQGTTHKTYNVRRIVSPGANSSRLASDFWMLPYDANRDAVHTALYRSDPYASYTGSNTAMFYYYVQDTSSPGKVKLRTTETWDYVCMVGTQFTLNRTYQASYVTTQEDVESRLRNWKPPGS